MIAPSTTASSMLRRSLTACLVAATLVSCTAEPADPIDVRLSALVEEQDDWDGRTVRTRGLVRSFDDPLHYGIEDRDVNRVELMPQEGLEPLVGSEIEVVGVFTFVEGEGRRIRIDELRPVTGSG